jgi:hypothetical protein
MRSNTTPRRGIIERKDGICCPARFKLTTYLKILALEEKTGSARVV